MRKSLPFAVLFIVLFAGISGAAGFVSGTKPLVDGIYNPTQVLITGRNPIFSWEYTSSITSFTVVVSSDADTYEESGEFWNLVGATTTANTSSGIASLTTRVAYAGAALAANTTYFWKVTIYDGALPASAAGQFAAVASAAPITGTKLDLMVDWNNPFNPANGDYTILRYTSADRNRTVKLRIYDVSGDLVKDWPESSAMAGAVYSENWDGRNNDGQIVARGIYLVNIMDIADNTGVTRRLFVIK